jgi:hypothetical protein
MAMNNNCVVGELRAINREKRTNYEYEYPYSRGSGIAKKGIPTIKIHDRKTQQFQIEQDSNFGGDTARKIIFSYTSKQRKSTCHDVR